MVTYHPVSWIHHGQPYLIDVEDGDRAVAIAVALNETGRKAVTLHSSYEILPDREVVERIKARVMAGALSASMDQVLREAAGGKL